MATTDHSYYRPSSFRSLLVAILVLTATLLALWQLSDIVKLLGAPLLYLPAQLGLVEQVSHAEVHVIDPFEASPRLLIVSQPGRYAVYTGDVQLLERTNALVDHQEAPWLAVKSAEGHTSIAVAFVERGLRPYDTPLAEGRPIFTFVVDTPGRYTLDLPERDGIITVVPDYTTGKEPIIWLVMLLQLGVMGTIVGVVVYIRTEPMRLRRQQQAAIDAQRQEQGEAFWQSEIQRSKDAEEKHE
jgi:hypothetical protein